MTLVDPHNGEWLDKITYYHDGAYDGEAVGKIDRLMRDWRNNRVRPIDPRSLDIVYTIARHFYPDQNKPMPPIEIVSGFRTEESQKELAAAGNEVAKVSRHQAGDAIDFRLPVFSQHGKLKEAKEFAEALQAGGVGYYPGGRNNFLHVDKFVPEPDHFRKWTVLPHLLVSKIRHLGH